ncbi:hypothetical protein Mth01_24450 [Sphaerimonospora thailandensis]|uniref:Uncharacterized protein n=2 Tax=Sphaerimonospora thailandensis TaxID=795644 RepID=A0A8J3R6V1_9ACTN|nr:hypothetical protein Mth01_24450 [Sphaerimonospora thailandensis]
MTLQMEHDPEGLAEKAGDLLQIVRLRVRGDLERFKEFMEKHGGEAGRRRGEVPGPHQRGGDEGDRRPTGSGTGYDIDEPMPPQPVQPEYPPTPPLPPPGAGPVPPIPPRDRGSVPPPGAPGPVI